MMNIKEIKEIIFKESGHDLTNDQIDEEVKAYYVALGQLCEMVGINSIKDLPVGYNRDGSGYNRYSRNGITIVYYWSKWVGDAPLKIKQILEEEDCL